MDARERNSASHFSPLRTASSYGEGRAGETRAELATSSIDIRTKFLNNRPRTSSDGDAAFFLF